MYLRHTRSLRPFAVAGLLSIVVGALAHAGLAAAAPKGQVEGSWMIEVTRETGTPLLTLLTFTADGSVLQTSSDHPTRSPGHGSWMRTGDRQVLATWWRLAFDEDGNFIERQRTIHEVTLNETSDAYSARSQIYFWDAEGNFLRSARTTAQAVRIRVEPLD